MFLSLQRNGLCVPLCSFSRGIALWLGFVQSFESAQILTTKEHKERRDGLYRNTKAKEALAGYSVHPAHVAVANGKVRPFTEIRSCIDFEV